jgi:hypothetical protein
MRSDLLRSAIIVVAQASQGKQCAFAPGVGEVFRRHWSLAGFAVAEPAEVEVDAACSS